MIDFTNVTELYVAGKEVKELHINGGKVWEKGGSIVSPLTFTAEQANSTVAMQAVNNPYSLSLEYSTDGGTTWSDFIVGTTTVTLANVGDKMCVRAKTTNSATARGDSSYNKFVMTGKIAASGSVMYLLKNDGDLNQLQYNYQLAHLFRDCASLTTAPELPATTLSNNCYRGMMRGTSITTTPALPATTLADSCYAYMFYRCYSLTTATELPATTLVQNCYLYMFRDCTALTTPPELPATTLAAWCYGYMFYHCIALTEAPYLPATTLANNCYQQMFYNCSSLNSIKLAYTGNFSGTGVPSNAFSNWVNGVASTGTLYYNGSDTTIGTSAIPTNWTVQSF